MNINQSDHARPPLESDEEKLSMSSTEISAISSMVFARFPLSIFNFVPFHIIISLSKYKQ
ncbi:hypothetical protein Hanom_Chr00s000004g01606701 [Helianthus anomalus]